MSCYNWVGDVIENGPNGRNRSSVVNNYNNRNPHDESMLYPLRKSDGSRVLRIRQRCHTCQRRGHRAKDCPFGAPHQTAKRQTLTATLIHRTSTRVQRTMIRNRTTTIMPTMELMTAMKAVADATGTRAVVPRTTTMMGVPRTSAGLTSMPVPKELAAAFNTAMNAAKLSGTTSYTVETSLMTGRPKWVKSKSVMNRSLSPAQNTSTALSVVLSKVTAHAETSVAPKTQTRTETATSLLAEMKEALRS